MHVTDFNYPVKNIGMNKEPCWEYIGNDYPEFLDMVVRVLNDGEAWIVPGMPRPCKYHREKLTHDKINLLMGMSQTHKYLALDWLRYPEDFPKIGGKKYARGFTTNYNYLYQLGLVTKTSDAQYRVTPLGEDFLWRGGSCPEYVINSGPEVIGMSETLVTFEDFYGQSDIEWLRLPLFWIKDESFRERILGDNFVPITAE